jgi:glycogen phosphorylase
MKSSAGKIPDKITADEIKRAFRDNLHSGLGRLERFATKNDCYLALALTVRERLFERTVETMETYGGVNARRVAYLSAEYLPGPHLANNLLNLGITGQTRVALLILFLNSYASQHLERTKHVEVVCILMPMSRDLTSQKIIL